MTRSEVLEAVTNMFVFAVAAFFAVVWMRANRVPWLACVFTLAGTAVVLVAVAHWFTGGAQ